MEELLKKIFRNSPSHSRPQLGWAGNDKVGKLWLPGLKAANPGKIASRMRLPFKGCTQLAFEDWWRPQNEQQCWVCWLGLDIDKDDNEGSDLIGWAQEFVKRQPCSMIRLSCGGEGLHIIYVLEKPIRCDPLTAGTIVKGLARPYKEMAEDMGIHVCKADRRMFWLMGGKNQTIYESDFVLSLRDQVDDLLKTAMNDCKQQSITCEQFQKSVSKRVRVWVERFVSGGALSENWGTSNSVYVGYAIDTLRRHGENPFTRSRMSGNGIKNGYIDITPDSISLWSYADGHRVWCYQDVEGMISE